MITPFFTWCVLPIFHVIKLNPIDGKTTNSHELRANLHHGKSIITRQNLNGYCLISHQCETYQMSLMGFLKTLEW